MTSTTKFAPETRKTLVKALGEILQTKPRYLGVPSCAYEIGEYHLAKDGTLTGPELFGLLMALAERGFLAEGLQTPEADPTEGEAQETESAKSAARESEEAPETAPAEEEAPEFPTAPEFDLVTIEYPRVNFDQPAFERLCALVAAKEELLKKALDLTELPIQVIEDRIIFPWFKGITDSAHIDAYATFICALCETALRKKRVTATAQPTGVNDRYRLRCFLLSLGMIGDEYALARKLLIGPMEGSSGWLTPPAKTPAPVVEAVVDTAVLAAAAAEVIEAAGGEIIAVTAEVVEAND